MLGKIRFPGSYVQGIDALDELPSIAARLGKRVLILVSASGERILSGRILRRDDVYFHVVRFGGECCEMELTGLDYAISEMNADVVVGMGGGKVIDTAKIAADRAGLPVIIVPTVASTDAACSGCAILYTQNGFFDSVCYQKSNPEAVLVYTRIIANAPARFLISGTGDALSTWFEARSCSASGSANCCGGLVTVAGLGIARLCYDTITAYGPAALSSVERHAVTPALERVVEANILLSGIGTEGGGFASAHAIQNGLTVLPPTGDYYHGEKLAFGVLAGLFLADADPQEIASVYAFCERMGLPTTLADIGLDGYSREKLLPAAERACGDSESTHNEIGTITQDNVVDAMLAADETGIVRKDAAFNR